MASYMLDDEEPESWGAYGLGPIFDRTAREAAYEKVDDALARRQATAGLYGTAKELTDKENLKDWTDDLKEESLINPAAKFANTLFSKEMLAEIIGPWQFKDFNKGDYGNYTWEDTQKWLQDPIHNEAKIGDYNLSSIAMDMLEMSPLAAPFVWADIYHDALDEDPKTAAEKSNIIAGTVAAAQTIPYLGKGVKAVARAAEKTGAKIAAEKAAKAAKYLNSEAGKKVLAKSSAYGGLGAGPAIMFGAIDVPEDVKAKLASGAAKEAETIKHSEVGMKYRKKLLDDLLRGDVIASNIKDLGEEVGYDYPKMYGTAVGRSLAKRAANGQ